MRKVVIILISLSVFACKKHPEDYDLDQSRSKEDYTEITDSISKGKFVPEEKTGYIFVTTNATVGGDTIYKSEN